MKKVFSALLLTCLLLTFLHVYAEESPSLNKKIEELTPKFSYETGKCLADGVKVKYMLLSRGDKITIFSEDDNFYYFDKNGLTLAVSRMFVRTEKEEPFTGYTGYTANGSKLYSDTACSNEINVFTLNSNVTVIDSFAGLLLVEFEGKTGYMLSEDVSSSEIKNKNKSSSNNNTQKSGDGEDIQLSGRGEYKTVFLSDNNTFEGTVLADSTEAYIKVLSRGDTVKVLSVSDNCCQVLISGHKGTVETKFIRKDSEAPYTQWDGFARSGAVVYTDYALTDKLGTCSQNDSICVKDLIDNIYVVELKTGETGYTPVTNVSESRYASSGAGKSSEQAQEWTDPVL